VRRLRWRRRGIAPIAGACVGLPARLVHDRGWPLHRTSPRFSAYARRQTEGCFTVGTGLMHRDPPASALLLAHGSPRPPTGNPITVSDLNAPASFNAGLCGGFAPHESLARWAAQ